VAAAETLGLGAIVVTAHDVDAATRRAISRHAYLHRCAPVWCHPVTDRGAGFPIQFVCADPDDELEPAAGVVDVNIELPPPTTDDRARLWRDYVPASDSWSARQRDDIIERPHVTIADIVDVADRRLTDPVETAHHLNARQRAGVGALLDPMPLPYRMSDLIIDDRTRDALDFLLFEVRQRRRRWSGEPEHRLLPMTGIVALLAGPPGVGKTMTAQVIAAELGVDLLRVNLADTISKYVGETAKNLHTVLTEADRLDAVLVFDEADTLFGRRTELRDAHDRYANADTNFLLQAIESYQGVALLATNRRDHVDEAFTRRLRHVIEFPFPDVTARESLWATLLDALIPDRDRASCDPVVNRLAEHCDLTGADIKHAILNARLIATRDNCRVDATTIVAGLDRELGKHRRALSDLARKRVLGG
jgi:adenylate kinase family enzyme